MSTTAERERAAAAALKEAQASLASANKAPKRDRRELLQRAGASATFAHDIAPQSESAAPAKKLAANVQSKLAREPAKKVDPYAEQPVLQLAPKQERTCCKVCSTGYACGNSCISRSKSCHRAAGCACDG